MLLEGRERRIYIICRLKCHQCGRFHRELPDCLAPFKHYATEVISGALDGIVTPELDGYHDTVKSAPYSVYGVISYLKEKNKDKILELERLERFYKACHAYTHGSIQIAKYPILHYFEISIMLYYVVRGTFLMLCKDAGGKDVIRENDIISMADKEFELLYKQYEERSTEKFEAYYSVK